MKYCFSCWICVLALLAFPVVGCGDLSEGSGGSGGSAGSGGAGTGGTAGMGGGVETVELTVSVVDGVVRDDPPAAGVEVCETDTDNCELTDANGQATIEVQVPANQRISYTQTKDGYVSILRTDMVDAEFTGTHWSFMVDDETMEASGELLATPYPMEGTGIVVAHTGEGGFTGLVGVTFELVGASGKGYYADAQGAPSLDLTSTIRGDGGFVEVAPGEVEIQFGGTGTNCVPLKSWPGSDANTISVPIKVGFASWSNMSCDAP